MKNPYERYLALMCAAAVWIAPGLSAALAQERGSYEWEGGKWVRQAAPTEGTPGGELVLIRRHFEKARYKKLVKAAKKFRARYPDNEAFEEVCSLAGRAEIKRGRYYQAFEWFEKQLNYFPTGRYLERALQREYEIAEAFLSGRKRVMLGFIKIRAPDDGIEILSRIAEHAPGTEIAAKSLLRIADYHYEKGRWIEATEAYDIFLELFPRSPEAPRAMLQGARATYFSFAGTRFDDAPLLDAEQRFKSFAQSYPAAAKKAHIAQTLERIVLKRASKLYRTGQFYERTKRPGAAAFYYKQLIDQYPGTQWARDAQAALRVLGEVKPKRLAPLGGVEIDSPPEERIRPVRPFKRNNPVSTRPVR